MDCTTSRRAAKRPKPKLTHDSVLIRPVHELHPSPENDKLYRPVNLTDPDIRSLAESIRERGVMEPIVVTIDNFIVSGHRRFAAAKLAGLTAVPVRVVPIRRADDIDKFVILLREHNRQRDKSLDEKLREELLTIKPADAYQSLIEHRQEQSWLDTSENIKIVGKKRRCEISRAKEPMLAAILAAINSRKQYWPLSDRQIHYALLNDPPLIHANKPNSRYRNNKKSYGSLVELLTRARLAGHIPWNAIADPTRPVSRYDIHKNPREFVRREMNGMLKGYWRDLMQSQPNHVEIIGEKNTVDSILKTVAEEYTIPMTTARGYCSIPPRFQIAQRFKSSGKSKLVLLMVSDFDPDGEEIAHSFVRSLRDDFGIKAIHPVKVALTSEQVEQYDLPPVMTAKESSVHYDKFVDKFGENVFELEALEASDLQDILREAIDAVIDTDAFNAELDAEKSDATWLAGVRNTVVETLQGIDLTGGLSHE